MDKDYYLYILSVISVVHNSFFCKENPFFFFLILISDFLNKNQVILIVIKISDLNQADLNQPTLVTSCSGTNTKSNFSGHVIITTIIIQYQNHTFRIWLLLFAKQGTKVEHWKQIDAEKLEIFFQATSADHSDQWSDPTSESLRFNSWEPIHFQQGTVSFTSRLVILNKPSNSLKKTYHFIVSMLTGQMKRSVSI